MDPDGSQVSGVSGLVEHKGVLYMGHLAGDYVSALDLSKVPLPSGGQEACPGQDTL